MIDRFPDPPWRRLREFFDYYMSIVELQPGCTANGAISEAKRELSARQLGINLLQKTQSSVMRTSTAAILEQLQQRILAIPADARRRI
jgi:hypothetical protein